MHPTPRQQRCLQSRLRALVHHSLLSTPAPPPQLVRNCFVRLKAEHRPGCNSDLYKNLGRMMWLTYTGLHPKLCFAHAPTTTIIAGGCDSMIQYTGFHPEEILLTAPNKFNFAVSGQHLLQNEDTILCSGTSMLGSNHSLADAVAAAWSMKCLKMPWPPVLLQWPIVAAACPWSAEKYPLPPVMLPLQLSFVEKPQGCTLLLLQLLQLLPRSLR